MTKRQKIVLASILSAGLVLVAMIFNLGPSLVEVIVVVGLVYLLSAWSLQPDLSGLEFATLLALPMLLTIAVVLTAEREGLPIPWKYFLPPVYGAVLYVTLLAENIFNVSVSRSIPLLRAARTIGYLLTLATTFVVSTLVFTVHLPSFLNFIVIGLVSGAAVGQALWQVSLDQTNKRKLLLGVAVSGLSVGELGLVISFWPVNPLGAGLAVTSLVYILIGLIQHDWQENLSRRAVLEYLGVTTVVLFLLFLTTSWGG